jgi:hypothetical protein
MAVSVRMDPLMEKELELAAKRKGVTKSQFIIDAVERALGRKDPYALMQKLIAEEEQRAYGPQAAPHEKRAAEAFEGHEQSYETDASRAQLLEYLKRKHGIDGAR